MKCTTTYLLIVFVALASVCGSFAQEDPLHVVQEGELNEDLAYIVGGEWEEADGFLQQQDRDQYLWAYPVVGGGDFHVSVDLKLQEMFNEEGRGAAASFAIDDLMQDDGTHGNNFGFVGGDGEIFVEGSFFAGYTDLGASTVEEDTMLHLDFIREGDNYQILLNDEEIVYLTPENEEDEPVFRSGYYRVGLRPWRSLMMVKNFTIEYGAANFDPIEEKIDFVADGVPERAVQVGFEWYEVNGMLENFDTGNFIFGDYPIFGSNYKVSAHLEMEDIEGSAASFTINGDNQFGFSGGSGTMFTGGSFFANAPSLDITPPIEESVGFDFEMISQDNKLRFLIDGNEVFAMDQPTDFVGFVGFRPWRSLMRISDFSVEPLQAEIEVPPETVRSIPEGQAAVYFAGETLTGLKLTSMVPEGKTSNATIIENLPEGWTASNIQANNGSVEFANGELTWQLEEAQGTVELTYDLTVPSEDLSTSVEFEGIVDTQGIDGRISGFSELFQAVQPNQEIYIVQNGQMTEYAEVIGEPWNEVEGALERTDTGNFLLSAIAVGDVDYEISADLTLFGLGGTAVSINLRRIPDGAQSNFGFEGGGGTFFTEGPFFDENPDFDYTTIEEGVPFTFKMVREGTNVDFMMDDEVILSDPQEVGEAFRVGLRPWRSRMQVTDFVIRTFEKTSIQSWSIY